MSNRSLRRNGNWTIKGDRRNGESRGRGGTRRTWQEHEGGMTKTQQQEGNGAGLEGKPVRGPDGGQDRRQARVGGQYQPKEAATAQGRREARKRGQTGMWRE